MAPEKSEILPQGWPSGARLPSCSERWALEGASEERKEALRLRLRLESQEQLGQFPSQKPSISSEPVVFLEGIFLIGLINENVNNVTTEI